ncbi:phage head-tail connector protein [Aeribacillus composti]|uniref:phage head-tail connector protein n=1 Tax=Aeribacillus composti TaxID=1868734 RepID=UPI00406A4480
MSIASRVQIRIPEIQTDLLDELVQTAIDRINVRLGLTEFPTELESVAVEVVCAMYNRKYHQGVKSEDADTFSISFVDDILREYEPEFKKYLEIKEKQKNANRGVLRFL